MPVAWPQRGTIRSWCGGAQPTLEDRERPPRFAEELEDRHPCVVGQHPGARLGTIRDLITPVGGLPAGRLRSEDGRQELGERGEPVGAGLGRSWSPYWSPYEGCFLCLMRLLVVLAELG